jgi:hypothetical protein
MVGYYVDGIKYRLTINMQNKNEILFTVTISINEANLFLKKILWCSYKWISFES